MRDTGNSHCVPQAGPLEQGQADRTQTSATTEARSGNPNTTSDRAAGPRACTVQSRIDSKLRGCDLVAVKITLLPNGGERAAAKDQLAGEGSN